MIVALTTWRSGRPDVAVVQEAWTADGREFPLHDLGPATTSFGVTLGEIGRTIGVDNHPDINMTEELLLNLRPVDADHTATGPTELLGSTSTRFRCTMSGSGGSCGPSSSDADPNVAETSSIDNVSADFDLWIWSNVPADTAFLSYTDPSGTTWQRPVARVAAFPVNGDSSHGATVTVYDTAGNTLLTMDARPDTTAVDAPAGSVTRSQRQTESLNDLNNEVLVDCLTAAGAHFEPAADDTDFIGSLLGTLTDSSLDPSAIWETCVHTTQLSVETVAAYLADTITSAAPTTPDT